VDHDPAVFVAIVRDDDQFELDTSSIDTDEQIAVRARWCGAVRPHQRFEDVGVADSVFAS